MESIKSPFVFISVYSFLNYTWGIGKHKRINILVEKVKKLLEGVTKYTKVTVRAVSSSVAQ